MTNRIFRSNVTNIKRGKNDFIHIYMYNSVFTCLIRKKKIFRKGESQKSTNTEREDVLRTALLRELRKN